jgi:predicted dehydrogenase
LLDIGVHLLDLALYTLDDFEPRAVSAATHSALGVQGLGEGGWGHSDSEAGGFDVEDFATALIHFKSGRTLSLDAAWALHQAEPEQHNLIHHGSRGAAGCYPAESYRYGEGQAYVVEPLGGPLRYPAQSPFSNFIDHLLGLEPLCVTPEQVLVVQRLLDAIYESARTGQQVTL